MEREALYHIAEDALRDEELSVGEIPAIDLYVDQIINLVSDKLKSGSERYRERQLTKTMINNYSKDGLITPVKGKKYNREQIVQILTVYTLKNTLSIGEIKRLLHGAYAGESFGGEELAALYDRYLALKRENRALAMETMEEMMTRYELTVGEEMDEMLLIGSLLSLSAFLRSMAQALIDEKYPQPVEPEEKKEKEKDKEKDKEEKKDKAEEKKEKAKKEKSKEKKKKEETEPVSPENAEEAEKA